MKFLYFLPLLLLCCTLQAQEISTSKKTVNLKGISTAPDIKAPTLTAPKTPSLFDVPKPSNSAPLVIEEKPIDLSGKTDFVTPTTEIAKKLNKPQHGVENDPAIKQNQNYGSVTSKSEKLVIMFRDFGAIDGDLIKLSVNSKVLIPSVMLYSDFKTYYLKLDNGFNKIDFEALNQGSSGPNTAEFQIIDDKGKVLVHNSWNLATGFIATFMVVKE